MEIVSNYELCGIKLKWNRIRSMLKKNDDKVKEKVKEKEDSTKRKSNKKLVGN